MSTPPDGEVHDHEHHYRDSRNPGAIGMTRGHMTEMARWRSDAERHLIRGFENGREPEPDAHDLADPIGHDLDFYRAVRDIIVRCVDHLAARWSRESDSA